MVVCKKEWYGRRNTVINSREWCVHSKSNALLHCYWRIVFLMRPRSKEAKHQAQIKADIYEAFWDKRNIPNQPNQERRPHAWRELLSLPLYVLTVLLPITCLCCWLWSWQGGCGIAKWQEKREEGQGEEWTCTSKHAGALIPQMASRWGSPISLIVACNPGDILVTLCMPDSVKAFCWSHNTLFYWKVQIRFFSSN